MNAKPAIGNDLINLFDPNLAGVFLLQRASRHKAAVINREHDRLEHGGVARVKRSIDENVTVEFRTHAQPSEPCFDALNVRHAIR